MKMKSDAKAQLNRTISWQEFVDNYRTFAAQIECNVKQIREVLEHFEKDKQ